MPDRRSELFREEDVAWAELCGLLEKIPPGAMERPGLNGDWSPKDLLGHLASWWAEAASQLERMRFGTFRLERRDIDEVNRRFYEANRDLDLHTVRAELAAARNRAFDALSRLPELNPQAAVWVRESGALHYRAPIKDRRRFVESLSSS